MKKTIIILTVVLLTIFLFLGFLILRRSQTSTAPIPATNQDQNKQPDVTDGAPANISDANLVQRLQLYPWTKDMPFFTANYTIDFNNNYQVVAKILVQDPTARITALQEMKNWLKSKNVPQNKIDTMIVEYKNIDMNLR